MPVSLTSRADATTGGGAPYGFRWEGGELVEDVAEQAVLTAMLQLASRGVAPTRIANILNRQGVPTRYGRHWWPATVINILRRHAPEAAPTRSSVSPSVPQQERPAQHRRRNRESMRRRRAQSTTSTEATWATPTPRT